jgi:hypothetical protein
MLGLHEANLGFLRKVFKDFIDEFSLWLVFSPQVFGRNKKGGHADADRHPTCKATPVLASSCL